MEDNVKIIAFWDKPGGNCYANLFCSDPAQMIEFIDLNPDFAQMIKSEMQNKIGNSETIEERNDDCFDRFEEFLNKNTDGSK